MPDPLRRAPTGGARSTQGRLAGAEPRIRAVACALIGVLGSAAQSAGAEPAPRAIRVGAVESSSPSSGTEALRGLRGALVLRSSLDLEGADDATPLHLGVDGRLRLDDWLLECDTSALGSLGPLWRRGALRLSRELPERGLELEAGDLRIATTGFQTPLGMAGLGLRSMRRADAAGATRAVSRQIHLEEPSHVEILVNGRSVRRMQLPAGRYDLYDFRLDPGQNEVTVRIEDRLGRRRDVHFSIASRSDLLEPGESEQSYAIGLATRIEDGTLRYEPDRLRYSLLHRYGIREGWTVGANLQGEADTWLAGVDAVLASSLGTLRAEAALSNGAPASRAHAARIEYEYHDATPHNRWRRRWRLTAARYGPAFRLPDPLAASAPGTRQVTASVSQDLPYAGVHAELTAAWRASRAPEVDERSVELRMRRELWRGWDLEVALAGTRAASGDRGARALLSVYRSVSTQGQGLRIDHESATRTTRLAWQLDATRDGTGFSATAFAARGPQGQSYGGGVRHAGPDHQVELVHGVTQPDPAHEERTTTLLVTRHLAFEASSLTLRPASE